MAPRFSLLIFSLLLLLSLSVNARPCKTFIISTYSFALFPQNPNPNPNSNFITIVTEVHPRFYHSRHQSFFLTRPEFPALERSGEELQRPQFPPFEEEFSSFRNRTKDILSVVASLLFGAACGALTAGTMYLMWSLFNHRNEDSYRSLDGFSSDDEDLFNPKKKGYVAIPATPEADPAPLVAPAKESA